MKTIIFSLGLAAISSPSAFAEDISVRNFRMLANSDCNDLFVEWNEDYQQLEVEFVDHNARTDYSKNIYDVLKRCNIRIDLQIPEGYRVAVGSMQVAYDGSIAPNGQGYTTLRYNFAGSVDDGFSKNLPDEGPFGDTITYTPSPRYYTHCGDTSVRLDMRSKVWVTTPAGSTQDSFVSFENGAGNLFVKNPEVKIVCGVVMERCGG